MRVISVAILIIFCLAVNCQAVVIWNTNIQDHKNDTVFEFTLYAPDFINQDEKGLRDTTLTMTLYEDGIPISTQEISVEKGKSFATSSKDSSAKIFFPVDGGSFKNQPFSSLIFEVDSASAIFREQKIDLLKAGNGLVWREWHPAPVFIRKKP